MRNKVDDDWKTKNFITLASDPNGKIQNKKNNPNINKQLKFSASKLNANNNKIPVKVKNSKFYF